MSPAGGRVCAVVVTYDRPRELGLVVAALSTQNRMPDRILVLDNASRLPAAEVLQRFGGVEIIRNETNLGGAGAFAAGLEQGLTGGCDWIWLMDDDAVPRPDALEELLAAAGRLPATAGALCPSVYEFGRLAPIHRRMFRPASGAEPPLPETAYRCGPREIDTASFVGFLVRAEAARAAGLPDVRFFLAYDDTEYSLRLQKAGWRIWLVPASGIDHLRLPGAKLRHAEFGTKHYYNIRNRIHVFRNYCSPARPAFCKAVLIGLAIWIASRRAWRPAAIRLLWRAVADGMRGRLGRIAN